MDISDKLRRSKSEERIDFTKIGCAEKDEPVVRIESTGSIIVEPIWTRPGDLEGELYARYILDHPEYDGVYVRSELLQRLEKASDSLADNLRLVVRAGHRPIEVQKQLLSDVAAEYKRDNPQATDTEALEHARMYVSDPDIKLPPHCCGAAVDVDLLNTSSGQLLDFGCPVNEDSEIAHLHSEEITPEQRESRLLLSAAMLDAGFSSYYAEWWHYSYGDQIWAWFYGETDSLYGLIDV